MAPRVSRPDRDVLFRPFSSRDAHIMLQLKRTAEVASSYPRMKIILDASLQAGKGARDPKQCPILEKLRGYDGEGKYSQTAPPKLAKEAAESVVELAIEPSVRRGVDRINALDYSADIVSLRERAKELYDESDVKASKLVGKLLHQPCIALRNGENVDVENVLAEIERSL